MFPETKSRETLSSMENKTNYFPREQILSVLLYSDKQKSIFKTFKQQLYFVTKTL
jgi:hypothetical protein